MHWVVATMCTCAVTSTVSVLVKHTSACTCFYCRTGGRLTCNIELSSWLHLNTTGTHLREWFGAKSSGTIPCHETAIIWFFLLQGWRNLIWFIRFRCFWSFLAWRFLYSSFVLRFLWRNSFLWTLLSVSNWSLRDCSSCFWCWGCCSFSCKPASGCSLRNTL